MVSKLKGGLPFFSLIVRECRLVSLAKALYLVLRSCIYLVFLISFISSLFLASFLSIVSLIVVVLDYTDIILVVSYDRAEVKVLGGSIVS